MANTIEAISQAVERLYRGFVLRDLLGLVLPGAISLFSIWSLMNQFQDLAASLRNLGNSVKHLAAEPVTYQVIIAIFFLSVSYVIAWLLQAVHNSIIDAIFQLIRPVHQWAQSNQRVRHILAWPWLAPLWLLFWPVIGLFYYMVEISKAFPSNGVPSPTDTFSLVVRSALSPDHEYLNTNEESKLSPEIRQQFARYPERISALMLMTGNLAIAGVLFLVAWRPHWLAYVAVLLVYLEYWRLLYTRNMQYTLHFRRQRIT